MGTIFLFRNIRIMIYSKDHSPPHVHAVSPKGDAKIDLETLECFFCRGYSQRDIKMIIHFVKQNLDDLLEAWNEIHS